MRPRSYFLTGASSGIGLELAKLLAGRGHWVIASGRRSAADLPVDFPDIDYVAADLGSESERAALIGRIPDTLDRAILTAGAGNFRGLAGETLADVQSIMSVNFAAQVHLSHALQGPLSTTRGRLGLVGSVAFRGASSMPVYAATKAAIDGFARSLSLEWAGRVTVKVLHPGPTATGMSIRAGRPADLLDRLMLPPAAVADAMLRALEKAGSFRQIVSYGLVARGYVWPGQGA